MAETTTTAASTLPQGYLDYYKDLSGRLLADIGKADYTPQSTGTLKSELQKIMRPTYEKSIQNRKQATAANRAAIDADAASRGMGRSTWVSDMKNRQYNQEARDIANINDDYSSALYSALMNRLNNQDQIKLAADQANMSARQAALGQALQGAQYFYERDQAGSGGGGGGGGGGRGGSRSGNRTGVTGDMPAPGGNNLIGGVLYRGGDAAKVKGPSTGRSTVQKVTDLVRQASSKPAPQTPKRSGHQQWR